MGKKNIHFIDKIISSDDNQDDTVIIACSGGADSMTLLDLYRTNVIKSKTIIVTHIHHGIRKSAARDQKIVEEYCSKFNIALEILAIDVAKEAKKTKTSLEECARNIRKKYLEKIRKKYQGSVIATAHHLDDQAETIIYRITKGTNITGLVGIEEKNGYYFRPLIQITKKEIQKYIETNNIPFGTDETNFDTSIPRNRIRHTVIPELQTINPEVNTALIRLGHSAQELKKSFDEYFSHVRDAEKFQLNWYQGLPLGFQHELIRYIYQYIHGSTHGLTQALVYELERFLSTRNGGKKEIRNMLLKKKQGVVTISEI